MAGPPAAPPKKGRGSSWQYRETVALLQLWGQERVQAELRASRYNLEIFAEIARAMRRRGFSRGAAECRAKTKKLRAEYKQALRRQQEKGGEEEGGEEEAAEEEEEAEEEGPAAAGEAGPEEGQEQRRRRRRARGCPFFDTLDRILRGEPNLRPRGGLASAINNNPQAPSPRGDPSPGGRTSENRFCKSETNVAWSSPSSASFSGEDGSVDGREDYPKNSRACLNRNQVAQLRGHASGSRNQPHRKQKCGASPSSYGPNSDGVVYEIPESHEDFCLKSEEKELEIAVPVTVGMMSEASNSEPSHLNAPSPDPFACDPIDTLDPAIRLSNIRRRKSRSAKGESLVYAILHRTSRDSREMVEEMRRMAREDHDVFAEMRDTMIQEAANSRGYREQLLARMDHNMHAFADLAKEMTAMMRDLREGRGALVNHWCCNGNWPEDRQQGPNGNGARGNKAGGNLPYQNGRA